MKIRIFGGIASGKTTLANYLGAQLNVPVYCTDDFVYTKKFQRRPEKERVTIINKSLKTSWIVEGVHYADWVKPTYKNVDVLIIIKKSKLVLAWRIIRRTFREEKNHYKNKFSDTFRLLWMMIRDTSKELKAYEKIAKGKKHIFVTNQKYSDILKMI